MIRCNAYELLSYLTNMDFEEDLRITAERVNRLEDLLRMDGIGCDFSKHSFEVAAYEYPDRFSIDEQSVWIKVQPKGHRKFVYYNSNREVALKIEERWQVVEKEF